MHHATKWASALILLSCFIPQASVAQTVSVQSMQNSIQDAVCLNDWDEAITQTSYLIGSSEISYDYRTQLIQFRHQLEDYRNSRTVVNMGDNEVCAEALASVETIEPIEQSQSDFDWGRGIAAIQGSSSSRSSTRDDSAVFSNDLVAVTNLRFDRNSIGVNVRGTVTNISDYPIEVFSIDYQILDRTNIPIYSGTFIVSETLRPGQTLAISNFVLRDDLQGNPISSLSIEALSIN